MPIGITDVRIVQVRGHWEVYINGDFFCSADNYLEAVRELQTAYG